MDPTIVRELNHLGSVAVKQSVFRGARQQQGHTAQYLSKPLSPVLPPMQHLAIRVRDNTRQSRAQNFRSRSLGKPPALTGFVRLALRGILRYLARLIFHSLDRATVTDGPGNPEVKVASFRSMSRARPGTSTAEILFSIML